MSVATVAVESEPDRHALVLLDCECGTCPPAWARRRGRSRRFTELAAALEREDAAAWRGVVGQHRERLEELSGAADRLIAVTGRDDPARPGLGSGHLHRVHQVRGQPGHSKRMVKDSRCAGPRAAPTCCCRSAPASLTTSSPATSAAGTPAAATGP